MTKKIIVVILILAFIGVVIFLDLPKIQDILNLKKQLEKNKEAFLEKQALLIEIDKLVQIYQENEENLEKLNYILPSGEDLPNLIVQLEALSFGNGLILEKADFSTVGGEPGQTRKPDYDSLIIKLRLIGSYESFEAFLKAVEENMRLIDIASINFSPEGQTAGLFNFDLELKTYYQ